MRTGLGGVLLPHAGRGAGGGPARVGQLLLVQPAGGAHPVRQFISPLSFFNIK